MVNSGDQRVAESFAAAIQVEEFTVATNVQVYFCDPRSPWQRGSNENTNGLLRLARRADTELSGMPVLATRTYTRRTLSGGAQSADTERRRG